MNKLTRTPLLAGAGLATAALVTWQGSAALADHGADDPVTPSSSASASAAPTPTTTPSAEVPDDDGTEHDAVDDHPGVRHHRHHGRHHDARHHHEAGDDHGERRGDHRGHGRGGDDGDHRGHHHGGDDDHGDDSDD
ncbi:hypothetical protein GCM10009795_060400 [Nocardioides hankookensis]|uniref:Uncharacterized protein n=1 Tax=Nocardioides hankookensis TaxID=443157 RepID=A0ABW1LP75_9ACTN